MIRRLLAAAAFVALVAGLPLAGLTGSGRPLAGYLEFPPLTRYVEHAPFSRAAFIALAVIEALALAPFLLRFLRPAPRPAAAEPRHPFPWWGWAGLGFGAGMWALAWTRLPWFAPWQAHTFTPLWLAYILVINAMTFRRTGRCPMTAHPGRYALLFPLSAAFWWFFEYLNRFAQNWFYTGTEDFSRVEYFFFATLSFSTVLPAVLGTEAWLASFRRRWSGFASFARWDPPARPLAAAVLLAAAAALAGLGRWPDLLFPALWLAPLAVLVALQALAGRPTFFRTVRAGDWRPLVRWALAALICGFLWELWNYGSLARWVYAVPYVQRFHLFEMPILGYAGYLPFGWECAVVAGMVFKERESAP